PTPAIYTLSLHDALPISRLRVEVDADEVELRRHLLREEPRRHPRPVEAPGDEADRDHMLPVVLADRDAELPNPLYRDFRPGPVLDRKSTRLNSSHRTISY